MSTNAAKTTVAASSWAASTAHLEMYRTRGRITRAQSTLQLFARRSYEVERAARMVTHNDKPSVDHQLNVFINVSCHVRLCGIRTVSVKTNNMGQNTMTHGVRVLRYFIHSAVNAAFTLRHPLRRTARRCPRGCPAYPLLSGVFQESPDIAVDHCLKCQPL